MANDLQQLRHARGVLLRKAGLDEHNSSLWSAADAKCEPIRKKSAGRVRSMERKCTVHESMHRFFTRWLPVFLLTVLAIAAVWGLARFVLSSFLPVTPDAFVERAREYAIDHADSFPTLLMTDNIKRMTTEGRVKFFNDPRFALDIYSFLAGGLIWATLAVAVVCSLIESKFNKKPSGVVFVFDILLILALCVWIMIKTPAIIGVLVGVVWMAFSGIPMMLVCGMPLLLVFMLLNAVVIIGTTAYDSMAARHRKRVAPNLSRIKALKGKIAAEKKACESACDALRKPFVAQMKHDYKNDEYYNALTPVLRDYSMVCQLIWVIESMYANTIPEARRFLEQRAQNAAVRKGLAEAKAASERAERAARDAEAAARAPVDVNVTIYYK